MGNLWDTAGQEDYDKLRPLSYPQTDAFMLCYSTIDPTSLRNVKRKWLPELRAHCPDAQIVLVGTKIDLRSDERVVQKLQELNEQPTSWQTGEAFAQEEKLAKYCECSALTQEGLKDAFCQGPATTPQSELMLHHVICFEQGRMVYSLLGRCL